MQTHGLDPVSIEKDNASTRDYVQMQVGELFTETSFSFTGRLSSLFNMSFNLRAKSGGVLVSPILCTRSGNPRWADIGVSLHRAMKAGTLSGFSMTYCASDDPRGPDALFHGLSGSIKTLSINPADQ